ncbi:unnamed protein product [Urochloa decumbens]|uniref:Cysteine-rich receptor-like protein kinase 10 n=1 Tax=Urochloa decumbens TaxID=240449 RepID=A0ABC8WFF7_9POAL
MNYTRGSAFQANLNATLSSLTGAASASSGFAENVTGAAPEQVYGLAQCRGDVTAPECRSCLDTSAREIISTCPGQKSAMLIYEGCLLRYSNTSFFGEPYTRYSSEPLLEWGNPTNVTQPEQFMLRLAALMGNLTREAAAHGSSPRMFAAGTVRHTSFVTIYGLAQCRRDMSPDNCGQCLNTLVGEIPKCCYGKKGGRVIARVCQLRFEIYQFYNAQTTQEAMSPAPAPGGVPANGSTLSGAAHETPEKIKHKDRIKTALAVSIPVAVTLVTLLLVPVFLCKWNRRPHKRVQTASTRDGDEELRSSEFLMYDLSTLRAATDNFSEENKLGEGGFGAVHKGTLQDGQEIAVKRLSATSQQGQAEMKNEVVLLAKLQHRNLVRLLGCCIDDHERLLIYEFLPNNSLDKILFDPARRQELGWGLRHKIIEGISRGLLYLHEDSRLTIIHRDLKASNILLDADMNPKISDFGLAKLFNIDGYMAPEYALHGIFSAKSDVFSYGVLVLQIVTGRRNILTQDSGPSEDLLTYVWRHWSQGSVQPLLEGCPAEGRRPQEMLRCIHAGLLCVQEDPQFRPGMASVTIMLNSRSITPPAPAAPAYALSEVVARMRSMDRVAARVAARLPSINDVSISDLEPR